MLNISEDGTYCRGIIDAFYPVGSALRDILVRHSRSVAELALGINDRKVLGLDRCEIMDAAMLHDIGIFLTDAPGIHCHGKEHYLRHGVLGAALLRAIGAPEWLARVAERHTGAGLTAENIRDGHLPLPPVDLLPETRLERLVCYADKFYSKSGNMERKPIERVRLSMSKFSADSLERFEALHREFS